jgi:phospholipase C
MRRRNWNLTSFQVRFADFFSAVPAETYPNRVFTLSATSYGYVANDDVRTVEGWPQQPIFAALDAVSVPWTVYFDEVSTAWLFQYTRTDKQLQNFHFMKQFYEDAAAGNLSSFVYIDPGYFDFFTHNASDQHPSHDGMCHRTRVQCAA